jgi:TP901 family phage tail tape measure protein
VTTLAGKALVPFEADTSGLLATISGAVGEAGKMFGGMVPLAIIGGIAAAGAAVVDLASKYTSATDLMAANSGITIKQANLIGSAFLATGGQTTFTAQEMMTAFAPVSGQLATLNGGALNAAQSMSFMSAAMALAEATGRPLASTVSSLASVMQAYGIPVKDAASASDLLYNVSRSLNMPIDSVASAVDKLHTKLGPLAPSLNDVGTLLLDLATHGVSGSRGLLAVNTGMTTLLGGSKATDAELKTLGLNVFDANGKFVGMASVIGQLTPKLATMTEAQRLAAEKALFGSGAAKTLDATIMAGLPGWDKAAIAADKTGTAQAGAAKATDNFAGMWDRLKTRVIDWATALGMQLMPVVTTVFGFLVNTGIPALGTLVGWVTDVINIFGGLGPVLLVVAGALGAWIAATLVMKGIGFATFIIEYITQAGLAAGVTGVWASVQAILNAALLANPIGAIIIGLVALAAVILLVVTHFSLVESVAKTVWSAVLSVVMSVWNAIKGVVLPILAVIEAAISVAFNVIKAVFTTVLPVILAVVQVWWTVVSTIFKVYLAIIIGVLQVAFSVITVAWNVLSTAVKIIVQALWDVVSQIFQIAAAIVIGVVSGIATALVAIWNAIKGWVLPIVGAIGFGITLAFTIVRDTLAVIWSVITAVIKTVWGAITTVFTTFATVIGGIFNGIRSVLSAVWTGIGNDVTGAWNGIVSIIKGAVNLIISIIDGIIGGINKVTGAIPFLGSKLQIPLIPQWHAGGGYFDSPTMIGVGESGPEVVLNRSQFQSMMGGGSGASGGAGQAAPMYNEFHVHGITAAEVIPAMRAEIGRWHGQALQLAAAKGRR